MFRLHLIYTFSLKIKKNKACSSFLLQFFIRGINYLLTSYLSTQRQLNILIFRFLLYSDIWKSIQMNNQGLNKLFPKHCTMYTHFKTRKLPLQLDVCAVVLAARHNQHRQGMVPSRTGFPASPDGCSNSVSLITTSCHHCSGFVRIN